MLKRLKRTNIVQSFLILKGNTRASVLYEPLWGIPFTLYSFYLSLYMKQMGISDQQLGGIIAAGFISAAVFSLFGGVVTDYLGRKKTTLIFDFISWPLAIFVFLISRSYWMFILATVINNSVKIVAVSWNLMVVEDADSEQRKVAYNLINLINISISVITPLSGLLVAAYGIITSERILFIFAIISMTIMIILRNKAYVETKVGQQILNEHKGLRLKDVIKKGIFVGAVKQISKDKKLRIIVTLQIFFNLTLSLGAYSSLYFAPFMTDHIGIDKASVSVLGGVYGGVMLFMLVVINPIISKKNVKSSMLSGLAIQGLALIAIPFIPNKALLFAIIAVGFYAMGYSSYMPFASALFADVSDGRERASIYSFVNTITSIVSALIGAVSGFIYAAQPRFIFYITVGIIAFCMVAFIKFISYEKAKEPEGNG